jgi:CRISPR-associated Csx2 family protein
MKKKIITFLGIYPKLTAYEFQGQVFEGKVFAQALCQFCDFDQMLVCMTDQAAEKTWNSLIAEESHGLPLDRIQPLLIPTGENSDQMWQIFEQIAAHIQDGDRVIFDITHGLRSLPFLVFLFAAYLKAAKSVKIEAIYYGAVELGASQGRPSPVIDLTEFIDMLDWLTATHLFTQTGEGRDLVSLLENQSQNQSKAQNPQPLKAAADAIRDVSLALHVTRPRETQKAAETLKKALSDPSNPALANVRPFKLLQDSILKSYGQFAISNTTPPSEALQKQFHMIKWYVDRQQTVQAATLAREWVITVIAQTFLNDGNLPTDRQREEAEEALGDALYNHHKRRPPSPSNNLPAQLQRRYTGILTLWGDLTNLRNDIAHCGMRSNADTAAQLQQRMKQLIPKLERDLYKLLNP